MSRQAQGVQETAFWSNNGAFEADPREPHGSEAAGGGLSQPGSGSSSYGSAESDSTSQSDGSSEPAAGLWRGKVCWGKVVGLVRRLWATRWTESPVLNRERYVKLAIREAVTFSVFLALLCVVAYSSRVPLAYEYTHAVSEIFTSSPLSNADPTTFHNLATIEQVWQYLTGPLLWALYNSGSRNLTNAMVSGENLVVEPVIIWQARVHNNSCWSLSTNLGTGTTECYGPYSSANENKDPFGPANSTVWRFDSEAGVPWQGALGWYGPGGYAVRLPADSRAAAWRELATLRDASWLDRATRLLSVDVALLNPNLRLYMVVRLSMEFPPTGGILTALSLTPGRPLGTPLWDARAVCGLLAALLTIYYLVEEVLELRNLGPAGFLSSPWTFLDISIIALCVVGTAFGVHHGILSSSLLGEASSSRAMSFSSVSTVAEWEQNFIIITGVIVFVAWIKVVRFGSMCRTLTMCGCALTRCAWDLLGYTLVFATVFLAFAQLAFLIFGGALPDFSSFSSCILTQVRILLGDFDFSSLEAASRIMGPIYFVSYVFCVGLIMMVMFLAIVSEAYSEEKSEQAHSQPQFQLSSVIKQGWMKVVDRLSCKKPRVAGIQKTLPPSGQINFATWRQNLKGQGFADAEIEAVFARYDGDGALTRAEQLQMRRDLRLEKEALGGSADEVGDDVDTSTSRSRHSLPSQVTSRDDDEDDDDDGDSDEDDDITVVRRGNHHQGGGGGVSREEFRVLVRRVNQMEHSIGSVVSKMDAVMVKLEAMERQRLRRRDVLSRLISGMGEEERGSWPGQEVRRDHMERLVRDELKRWDSDCSIRPPGVGVVGGSIPSSQVVSTGGALRPSSGGSAVEG
ncbi:polycystin-2-like isoform X1 [Lampetra fluviatilis]